MMPSLRVTVHIVNPRTVDKIAMSPPTKSLCLPHKIRSNIVIGYVVSLYVRLYVRPSVCPSVTLSCPLQFFLTPCVIYK